MVTSLEAVLQIDRRARIETTARPSQCLAILAAVEAYPSWSTLITSVDVVARRPDGLPARVRLRAQVLGLSVEMECALELTAEGAVLRRLPYDAEDDERYVATWSVVPSAGGASVELHVVAALDAPGAARLIHGRVARRLVDDVLADFEHAV